MYSNPMYANPRSVLNNLKQFQSLIYSKTPDIIGLTETWLNQYIFDNEILPSNHTLFCKDCPSHGGGVLIAVNNKFPCHVITLPKNLETRCIKLICLVPLLWMLLTYLPVPLLTIMIVFLTSSYICIKFQTKMIILGDFNLTDID